MHKDYKGIKQHIWNMEISSLTAAWCIMPLLFNEALHWGMLKLPF